MAAVALFGNKVGGKDEINAIYNFLGFSLGFQVLGFELYDTLNKKNLAIFFYYLLMKLVKIRFPLAMWVLV